jgi:ribosomal protein S18 acetylase RimI-like enzyme
MICLDWRDEAPEVLVPLYTAERRRWAQQLGWDLGPSLRLVEQARVAGDVPGLVLHDSRGVPVGWAYYILSQGSVQIGALNAATAGGLRLLLDRIFRSPEAHVAQELSCFLYPVSSSVVSALNRQRFVLEHPEYLSVGLPASGPVLSNQPGAMDAELRSWSDGDTAAAVRLVARSYAGDPSARCFAPHGQLSEWAHYVGQLLNGPGCGAFLPDASLVVPSDAAPCGLGAAIVMTTIAPGTAHVAQLVVDPLLRRKGYAKRLLITAAERARDAGARRLTLIVSPGNDAARALYARLGFTTIGKLLYGYRGAAPRRFAESVVGRGASGDGANDPGPTGALTSNL